jgi:hypothetical protein
MAERRRLEVVDDPVLRAAPATAPPSRRRSRSAASPQQSASPEPQEVAAPSQTPPPDDAPPVATTIVARTGAAQGFRGEEKRAVFGRVPRSLSRRLERALVELREEMEDLTQEQILAALLSRHVNPAEPESLAALAETVRAYRDAR